MIVGDVSTLVVAKPLSSIKPTSGPPRPQWVEAEVVSKLMRVDLCAALQERRRTIYLLSGRPSAYLVEERTPGARGRRSRRAPGVDLRREEGTRSRRASRDPSVR